MPKRQTLVLPIAVIAFAIASLLFMMDYALSDWRLPWSTKTANTNAAVACTLEAKLCPDGSAVGRTGPHCEFAPCPETNANVPANTNATTNSSGSIDGLKTYTSTVYGYSLKYPSTYAVTERNTVGEMTPAHVTFYRGQTNGVYDHSIIAYVLTADNFTGESFSGQGDDWYHWATAGFPDDHSTVADISTNKHHETYGGKTFTVVEYDPASSWGGAPFYYYVDGDVVYLVADVRGNSDSDVQTILSSLTLHSSRTWKTYSSATFHVSFNYPPDWSVTEGDDTTPYRITAQAKSGGGTMTLWIGNAYSNRCGEDPVTTTSTVRIGGMPATLYAVSDKKVSTCHHRSYLLARTPVGWTKPSNATANEIQAMADDRGRFSTVDVVLNTLTLQDPVTNWQTYINKTDHYSLKYPNTYTQSVNGSTIEFLKNGSLQQSAEEMVTVSVFRSADLNINVDDDLYTWAKNGFSAKAPIVAYHNHPIVFRLGENTFIRTDGDQGSSGIPEYFIFHNNVLYELTDLHPSALSSDNQNIISTLHFTE